MSATVTCDIVVVFGSYPTAAVIGGWVFPSSLFCDKTSYGFLCTWFLWTTSRSLFALGIVATEARRFVVVRYIRAVEKYALADSSMPTMTIASGDSSAARVTSRGWCKTADDSVLNYRLGIRETVLFGCCCVCASIYISSIHRFPSAAKSPVLIQNIRNSVDFDF